MKRIITIILSIFLFLTCSRDWKNPLDADIDLTQPEIIKIELNEDNFIIISLNHSYPDTSTLILERKSQTAFEQIEYQKIGQSTILDNSFDREINHSFIYKAYVKKGEYRTDYSKEKNIQYSASLNSPSNLVAVSVELQGIRLEWNDNSNNEDSYKIEKNDGSGFIDFATVGANTESYFDVISGTPPTPLQFEYRVKAISSNLESDWINISTEYSGLGSPTNLRITNSSSFNFTIEWDDNSSIESGFLIEKKIDSGSFLNLAEVAANSTSFTDTISAIGTYSYRVRTKQNNYYSSYSNEITQSITSLFPAIGLVAYYPFNGNANDISSYGNHGIVNGPALTNDRFNIENNAYSFDGINDYIEVPHDTSLNLSTSLSISIWVNAYNNTQGYLVAKGDHNYYAVSIGPNNSILSFFAWLNSNFFIAPFTYVNEWKNVILTFDSSSGELIHYIDGVKILTSSYSNPINTTTANLQIGRRLPSAYYYEGLIDDIAIYNHALSSDEIQAIFHDGGWTK